MVPREKKRDRVAHQSWGRPAFERARAEGSVDLEVALLAERRARGGDGQRMRFAAIGSVLARPDPSTDGCART